MPTCGSLFSGVGLLDYGLTLAGWEHAWFCEADEWRRSILEARWPGVPVYSDVRELDDGLQPVDLIAGGFPCRGVSSVGKRQGFGHPETVLWREMARTIRLLRPRFVLVENVAALLSMAPPGGHAGELWAEVLGALAESGYDTEWEVLRARDVGAPHGRPRVLCIATHRARDGKRGPAQTAGADGERAWSVDHKAAPDPGEGGCEEQPSVNGSEPAQPYPDIERSGVRVEWGPYRPAIERWERIVGSAPEPLVSRVDARGAGRVDRSRLSALGDGVQVQVGQLVGEHLMALSSSSQTGNEEQ